MLSWLFTPIHKTYRMTPVTCFTTLICVFVGSYFAFQNPDDPLIGMMKGVFVGFLIALANLGAHEVLQKRYEKKEPANG